MLESNLIHNQCGQGFLPELIPDTPCIITYLYGFVYVQEGRTDVQSLPAMFSSWILTKKGARLWAGHVFNARSLNKKGD